MSVHDNFQGNWDSASDICEKRGGYLWSVNNGEEWDDVLSPRRYNKENLNGEIELLNLTNVIKYFRTSSLIYLGLKYNGKVRLYCGLCITCYSALKLTNLVNDIILL